MARMIGCAVVALVTAGFAQSAPTPHIRFVSLAEARAIALENAHLGTASPVRVLGKARSQSIVLCGVPRSPRPAEVERTVGQLLLNVEVAYWNLYGSYWQVCSREQGLRLAEQTWKTAGVRCQAGKSNPVEVAQAEGQYNLFRSQYLQALDTALDNERQLRAVLGLPVNDKTRLVPSDAPRLSEKQPDWEEGLRHALKRPELYLARQDVKVAQLNLLVAKNIFLPLGRWLGLGDANCVREAQLTLARARLVLQDQELKAERYLGLWYRRTSSAYSQIKAARAQREAFAKQLEFRSALYRAGDRDNTSVGLVLEAQRFWADALATECQAITTYNNALVGWEFAGGDIRAHAHVKFADAPASRPVVRAVAQQHGRTRRQVRREPGVTADLPLTAPDAPAHGKAPSLPALWKSFPPLRAVGELPSADHAAADADPEVRLVEWKTTDIFPPARRSK